jgi:hypothetical protein
MFIGGGVYQRPDDTNVGKRVSDFEFVSVMIWLGIVPWCFLSSLAKSALFTS